MKKILTLTLFFFSISVSLFAQGFDLIFDDTQSEIQSQKSTFDVNGNIDTGFKLYLENIEFKSNEINPFANLNLNLDFRHPVLDAKVELNLESLSEEEISYKDIIREISLSYYIPNGKIQAGYFIHRWGVVDTARVVDLINVNDYREGFSLNPFDMKVSEAILLTQLYFDDTLLEFVYKPVFTPIRVSNNGRWNIKRDLTSLLIINESTVFSEPKINSLNYGSFGAKIEIPFYDIETSLMFYRGYYEIPGYKYTLVLSLNPPYQVSSIESIYTLMNIIGADFSYINGAFSIAGEIAYYISSDKNSTNYALYNNRLNYTGSLNYKINNSSTYITLSYNGSTIFDYSENEPFDVDFNSSPKQDHNIIMGVHLPLFNEKVLIEAGLTYQVVTKGYLVLSKVDYNLNDDITLSLCANVYNSFDTSKYSLYKTWDSNDFVAINFNYQF